VITAHQQFPIVPAPNNGTIAGQNATQGISKCAFAEACRLSRMVEGQIISPKLAKKGGGSGVARWQGTTGYLGFRSAYLSHDGRDELNIRENPNILEQLTGKSCSIRTRYATSIVSSSLLSIQVK
jgi:hypothetical protein